MLAMLDHLPDACHARRPQQFPELVDTLVVLVGERGDQIRALTGAPAPGRAAVLV
jgi:hypothetical protein